MKKNIQTISKVALILLFTISFQLFAYNSFAQSPQSFQYQAVVRDASGNALQSVNVSFKLSIILGPLPGTVEYVETHSATTNIFGIATLAVGSGTPFTNLFSDVDWSTSPHFLKVEADPTGGGYINMGTTQLLSVPYALYAETAGNAGQTYTAGNGIDITGNVITNTSPNIPVSINSGTGTSVSGTYPNFVIDNTNQNATHTGDVTGSVGLTITNNAVTTSKIADGNVTAVKLNSMSATTGQVLKYNGTNWAPAADASNTYTGGIGITLNGSAFDAQATTALWNANKLQGNAVASTTPTINQVLKYNGTNWLPSIDLNSGTPGGLNKTIQFNSSGSFGGDTAMIWDNTNKRLGVGLTSPNGRVVIKGSATAPATEPLFEIKNAAGQTVFVVYPDSVHFYIKDSGGSKSNQGGFAVSGRNNAKAYTNDYLFINPDYTRVFTGDPVAGFGVQNINTSSLMSYMQLSPYNYFIGHKSGINILLDTLNGDGVYNSTLGFETGMSLTSGSSNVFVGYKAGRNQSSGYKNVAVGSEAGLNTNTTYTTFLGSNSGQYAGGDDNVYVGYNAGNLTSSADNFSSVVIGSETGRGSFGASNTIIGSGAGFNFTATPLERNDNIFIGVGAGGKTATYGLVDGNICIGNDAGTAATATGSNQLYIENSSDVTNPLIHGDFLNNRIAFHRKATAYPLQVGNSIANGNGAYLTAGGAWTTGSSRAFKDRFTDLNGQEILNKIAGMELKGWFYKETQEYHIGPFAEDFYQAFGTGVLDIKEDLGRYLFPGDVAGVSLVAIQALVIENNQQKILINQLIKRIEKLENR